MKKLYVYTYAYIAYGIQNKEPLAFHGLQALRFLSIHQMGQQSLNQGSVWIQIISLTFSGTRYTLSVIYRGDSQHP
ncbi:hypothetical protein ACJIZ3_001938 [Penstemon smallii]|uniref:Uncharacterized protein n=1 Tax=Penstemon smallii TaxID=265156 RepID=A0ABD3U5D0_9LAMI